MPRAVARRRGDVGGFRIQWSALIQLVALALAAVGIYVGVSVKLAVLETEVEMLSKTNGKLESKVDSMQSNLTSFERYLQDMNQQMARRR